MQTQRLNDHENDHQNDHVHDLENENENDGDHDSGCGSDSDCAAVAMCCRAALGPVPELCLPAVTDCWCHGDGEGCEDGLPHRLVDARKPTPRPKRRAEVRNDDAVAPQPTAAVVRHP